MSCSSLLLFTFPLTQWTPEQWIALIRAVAWPAFCFIVVIAWHAKVGRVLDAGIYFFERMVEFEAFGAKIKAIPPELVKPIENVQVPMRFRGLPAEQSFPDQVVPEKIVRLPLTQPRSSASDGSANEGLPP